MNIAEIIANFRIDTSLSASQTSDNTILSWINRIYSDLINDIINKVNEDFFYNEWTSTLVNWQREYVMLEKTSTIPWMFKIKWISIKKWEQYIKCKPEVFSNLNKDLSYYSLNQPENEPFYIISDNSVFIYPTPKETITNWIKFFWIASPINLTLSSLERDIKIPVEFHELINVGLLYHSYRNRTMINEKNDAKSEYMQERQRMITNMSDRIISPLESEMPYIANLW